MPPHATREAAPAAIALANRLASSIGLVIREERRRRSLTTRQLADRARVSPATVNAVEAGRRVSLDVYARVSTALGLSLDVVAGDRRRARANQDGDSVHAAMGEYEVGMLEPFGYRISIDHPYQHYQFAGRADVLAWSTESRALLHIENRTRFPNLQEAAGSFNAKCQYLAPVLARQLRLQGFTSQVHVMAVLWSSEVLHSLRLKKASFRALCPDDSTMFMAWLGGEPARSGVSRALVLLDPFAVDRQDAFAGLSDALSGARPRVRGYSEAAARLRAQRRA